MDAQEGLKDSLSSTFTSNASPPKTQDITGQRRRRATYRAMVRGEAVVGCLPWQGISHLLHYSCFLISIMKQGGINGLIGIDIHERRTSIKDARQPIKP